MVNIARRGRHARIAGAAAVATMAVVSACTQSQSSSSTASTPPGSTAAPASAAQATSAPSDAVASNPSTDPAVVTTTPPSTIAAPTGEPFVIGVVNTEGGPAGLDFPEIRTAHQAAANWANETRGGIAGRPIELVTCASTGTPEASQSCAQQLTSSDVDLVLIGFDVFVDYTTFAAAELPIIGVVPVLPGDYSAAQARYLTGGNLVIMTTLARYLSDPAYAKVAKAGVILPDSPASNSGLAQLEPSMAKGGVELVVVKGGENATDAEYQSLLRSLDDAGVEAIISLYGDAGCIGTMRARQALGMTQPAYTTGLCASAEVIDGAGDAAVGWTFAGAAATPDPADVAEQRAAVADVLGTAPDSVDIGGFAGLGWLQMLTVIDAANQTGLTGDALTGQAIFDRLGADPPIGFGSTAQLLTCGRRPDLVSLCGFALPFARVDTPGQLTLLADGELIDGEPMLP
jgi:branched-chain amino acid transport system substrate-binding protein